MANTLYADVTNSSNILTVQLADSHSAQVSNAIITAESTGLDVGDSITVDIGYSGDHDVLFTGYVKSVERKEPTRLYTISASNVLVRAMDYFIVSADQDNPFSRSNIKAEHLVRDVLELAGITNFSYDPTSFTFAIHNPVEVNITSAYDYSRFIANLIAWHLYGDKNGTVYFVDRKPYVMPGDSSLGTLDDSNILDISYSISEKDLRNRVVVYGAGGISAEAKTSSPYLPAGFYKTVLASAPDVIDTQSMANQAAAYNLELYNRLTKKISCSVVGSSSYEARQIYTVDKADIGATGDWYVYGITHDWSRAGYVTSMELRAR